MYNVNQSKRFKRPFLNVDSNGFHVSARRSPADGDLDFVHYRRPTYPADTLRGAMLVAVVVVTIVLYITLWELERSSFASAPVPKLSLYQSVSGISNAISTRHPYALGQDEPVPPLDETSEKPLGEHILVTANNPSRSMPDAWLPSITSVPEEYNASTDVPENEDMRLQSFDVAHCSGTCRFLLPVRIGEQESKARIHFMQLAMLARRLGRTIVLPNVGKGRMGACSTWPFSVYYDTSVFSQRDDYPDSWPAMDLERFSKWIGERPSPPSSFVVSLDNIRRDHHEMLEAHTTSQDIPFVVQRSNANPKIVSCLQSKLGRLQFSLPETALSISFDSRSVKAAESDHASELLVRLLSSSFDVDAISDFDLMTGPTGYEYAPLITNGSHLSLADTDVLVIDYDLRHLLFPANAPAQPSLNLHYASALYDLADRLSDNLGPFVGVHWRMETVPVQNLAWCAASLVITLHALPQNDEHDPHQAAGKLPLRHVWFATDYPRPLSLSLDLATFLGHEGRNDQRTPDINTTNTDIISNAKTPTASFARQYDNHTKTKSSTFPADALSSEHDDAIEMVVEAFRSGGDLELWRLTDLAEQLRRYPYVEGRLDHYNDEGAKPLLDDPGVLGILDKLVIVQARVYVSGSTDCGKTSSFTKQIIEARRETFEAERGKGTVRNVVEYFGQW